MIQSKTFEDTRCLVFAISSYGGICDDEPCIQVKYLKPLKVKDIIEVMQSVWHDDISNSSIYMCACKGM